MKLAARRLGRGWALPRTIRARLTLWYVALLAIILVAFSAFLYLNLSRTLRVAEDQALRADAGQIAASLDIQNGQPRLNDLPIATGSGSVVSLYDARGKRVLGGTGLHEPLAAAGALTRAAAGTPSIGTVNGPAGQTWRVFTRPAIQNGRIVAVLAVARTEEPIQAALNDLLGLLAIAIPLTLLLAVAGGLFLASRALDPIDRVTRAAGEIGARDLSRRLNLPDTPDEVGRLTTTFDGMLDRIEDAFHRERQFTADASHELRTPLSLLTSQAEVTLQRPRKAAEYREALTNIRQDAARMEHLLSELLVLARADAGHEQITREPLHLADLLDDVISTMLPLACSRGVSLRAGDVAAVTAEGDQTRLTQLLVNLIDNGLKYTSAGGSVTVSIGREGDWAAIRVADTGVGIAPEHLPRLFERFYRADKARSRAEGGDGLGLAISQWIAQAHGGRISVESEPRQGSIFTLRLPLDGARRGS
ncbi:MAG: sensor histidine kinase [Chloroflexota bacterium]